ncbi:hypothetical protein V6R21_31865 [Limibacter armeniacum]|uniref:hypothetical protein n=1 Tax=Limibacter armeniacum TaxID=466084 RepID=UPI002FE6AF63
MSMSTMYKESYLPVDHDFREQVIALATQKKHIKVFYFDPDNNLEDAKGSIIDMVTNNNGEHALIGGKEVRLDKIIALDGKPGPSYDEYDSYGNACMNCNLGYD